MNSGSVQLTTHHSPAGEQQSLLLHQRSGGGYDSKGASPPWKTAPGGVDKDEDVTQHRCARPSGWKPFVFASIAIGAGSFAQGCVWKPGGTQAPAGP